MTEKTRPSQAQNLLNKNLKGLEQKVADGERAEMDLGKSEEKILQILSSNVMAIFIIDKDHRITHWNHACEELTGVSSEEIRGTDNQWKPFYKEKRPVMADLILGSKPEENIKKHYADKWSRSSTIKGSYEAEDFFPHLGEKGKWLLFTATPIFDDKGQVAGAIEILQDITEKKLIAEKLKKSEERYRKLVNTSPNEVALLDEDGYFLVVNPVVEKNLGLAKGRILGMSCYDIMPRAVADKLMEKGREAIAKGGVVSFENKRDGKYFDTLFVPIFEPGGRNSFQFISKDITKNKKMEKKLKEMSLYDPLTGIYNRTFFNEEMRRLRTSRYHSMAVIVCDIDGLKIINDTLGHEQGDRLLKTASKILRKSFRANDIIARIGGDEFSILLPDANEEKIGNYCRRIRWEIKEYNQNRMSGEFRLSISMGYSIVNNSHTIDMNKLFREADDAMYKEKLQKKHSSKSEILQALIATMDARDHITGGHSERLGVYTKKIGESVNLSEKELNDLNLLARFHDLGKVGIPDNILFKKNLLTEKEFEEMKRHCYIGQRIASSTSDMSHIADYILKHHEWWDGNGYPLKLKGEEIPLLCRILAIADAYDAMTEDRPYRKALTHEQALSKIEAGAGSQFDPYLVKKFLEVMR
jgi:diguanylate cyclase (GGDEF)-like protein/PAS domain S-box-containing protein